MRWGKSRMTWLIRLRKELKCLINARQAIADSCRFTRSHQAASHLDFQRFGNRFAASKATLNPLRRGFRIFACGSNSLPAGSCFSYSTRISSRSMRLICGQRCGLAYTSPSVPCISNARPPISLKNFATRPMYSGCETLERRSASPSANGVASFARVCALLRTPIRQRIASCFSSGGQNAPTGINTG